MRALAHIEEVKNIRPIEGCDNIEQCNILGWNLIVKKGEFREGDKAVYIEIDSILPSDDPHFALLENKHYKIKTMKMRGTISQGIAFPLSILPNGKYNTGDNVTEILRIKQIEDEVPKAPVQDKGKLLRKRFPRFTNSAVGKYLMGYKWFRGLLETLFIPKVSAKAFPKYIIKTDEERIQNTPGVLKKFAGVPMLVTEKLDGCSASFGVERLKRGKLDISVSSRNVRQIDRSTKHCFFESNVYWEMFDKYKMGEALRDLISGAHTAYIQGEIIGESIQKNKYGIAGRDLYIFNIVVDGERLNYKEAEELATAYGLKFVPILSTEFDLPTTVEELVSYADGKSELADTLREGVVIRDYDSTVSFEAISNKFLLKHNI